MVILCSSLIGYSIKSSSNNLVEFLSFLRSIFSSFVFSFLEFLFCFEFSQIMEELENLEETLNESIRESLGARVGGMSHAKKKGVAEDEEEYSRYL